MTASPGKGKRVEVIRLAWIRYHAGEIRWRDLALVLAQIGRHNHYGC